MDVSLSPELEQFAAEAVASGRYRDTSELVAAALGLLKNGEAELAAFIQSLEEAEAQGEREGFLEVDDVAGEMMALIEAKRKQRA